MRFGIMAMQIDSLIPSGVPAENILAHLASFDLASLSRDLHQQGFNLVELGNDLGSLIPQTFAPPAVERLAALKSELGLNYTVHLPLWSVEPSTPLTPVRQGSVQAIIDAIRVTLPLDPEVYVFHATGALAAEFYRMQLPEIARSVLMRVFQAGAQDSLQAILMETGLSSRRLAIETIEFPFDLTLDLAEQLDLSMCLDTGHVLVGFSGPIDIFEALERCLPRLAEIHLHDGPWQGPERKIGYNQDHKPLGAGDLDVGRLFDRLESAGFQGPLIFELRVSEALASLERIKSIRPQALVNPNLQF
jgi:sugar phosphate isomerase/epimerase